jgi:LDH2 family malate/lactate/ureidoglycolate dehydrogenase
MEAADKPMVTMSVEKARDLGIRALRGIGYAEADAKIIADHLTDASATGYAFAGLPRILALAEERQNWPHPGKIAVKRETAVSALIDGASNVGYLVGAKAADIAVEKAKLHGLAIVGAYNTYFSGRGAYYAERIARQGLGVIHTVSAFPAVVPSGGTKPVMGTNPICIALPSNPDPFILDLATSSISHGQLLLSRALGKDLPAGVAIDHLGGPTRDASAALAGGILPFGDHKGFGLALAVQLLGLVAGADLGRGQLIDSALLFIAFDPALLRPLDELQAQMSQYLEEVRSSPTQPGVDSIRIPSERSFAKRRASLQDGLQVDAGTVASLELLAVGDKES